MIPTHHYFSATFVPDLTYMCSPVWYGVPVSNLGKGFRGLDRMPSMIYVEFVSLEVVLRISSTCKYIAD